MLNILLITLLPSQVFSGDAKCRGLAFSGGSDNGPYQAGAFKGLVENLPSGEAAYDVVTGISVGAFNALVVSRYAKGEEVAAAQYLESFWENFSYSLFYKDWTLGILQGLTDETGLYNSAPMDDAIPQKLMPNSAFNRMLVVGATDLKSANYVTFNSTLDSSKVQTGVKASATMTGLFPVVNYKDFTLIEGTIKYGVDIISAVTYCQSQGFANEDIIVDVIMATYKKLQEVDASQFSTIQSLFRYLSITSYLSVMDQVTNSQHYYPNVTLNVVTPSEDISTYLTNISPYDFSKSDIEKFFNIGYSDGKEAASDRSSVAFE